MSDYRTIPKPARPAAIEMAIDRWIAEAVQAGCNMDFAIASVRDGAIGSALMNAVFGNSPFLTACWIAEPDFVADWLAKGPDKSFADLLAGINDELALAGNPDALMAPLRRAKRRAALAIALADLAGAWTLEQVTDALSLFAERAVDVAAAACVARQIWSEPAAEHALGYERLARARSGLVILGMGKLGARELNYSSDIDLIVLFDPQAVDQAMAAHDGARIGVQQRYIRAMQQLIRVLQERTVDGYVFRTDLRLRPDPASTPLVLSVAAAENYYQEVGQNWERAAMIKARPIAADLRAGERFLATLRPFIWRKHLDFAAISDIHSIKRQIHAAKGGGKIDLLGHDVKLGRGGIREIEFFVQTQQLIWGGRDASLRVRATCDGLSALVRARRIDQAQADRLASCYRFLRHVEHRLQMVEDAQTHKLPTDPRDFADIARFCGFPDAESCAQALRTTFEMVQDDYVALFEDAPDLAGAGSLVFTGVDDDPETLETLRGMGFTAPDRITETVRGWHHGRMPATRSARAREILTELMPDLLAALARTPDPDFAFTRFDQLLANLSAGVHLFALFQANPDLLRLVARIMGTAPSLGDYLSRRPAVLEGVLASPLGEQAPSSDALSEELGLVLADAKSFEDTLDLVRRFAGDRRFQVGVRLIGGAMSIDAVQAHLSALAIAVTRALLPRVEAAFAEVHGVVPGGRFAVFALGKLGAGELAPGSDLDLVFLYDAPEEIDGSDGRKPLAKSLYFQRLGQRLIAALTAPTAEGELYAVDMRLRPSGNKGPIASSADGFLKYQQEEAWTWEHMALTRARGIAGSHTLIDEVARGIRAVLARPREEVALRMDVREMRARIRSERPPADALDVKDMAGGLVDVEFITQYLLLRHAAAKPELITGNTVAALRRLATAGLITAPDALTLVEAARRWQTIQGLTRLTLGPNGAGERAPAAVLQALARASGAVDFAALRRDIEQLSGAVSRLFVTVIGADAESDGTPRAVQAGDRE